MAHRWTGLILAIAAVACDGGRTVPQSGFDGSAGGRDAEGSDGAPDTGAGDAEPADEGTPDAGEPDAGQTITIPDPGMAMNDWGLGVNAPCCGTPDTAYPAGIITMDSGYVQGNIDASGDFFYVFRAGPALTQLTWTGFIPGLDLLDLHDGDGLIYGPVIPPIATPPNGGTWTVTPNRVYVLHLHSTSGGFF